MRRTWGALLLVIVAAGSIVAHDFQSLVEAARKEAERRQKLDEQNIKGKTIDAGAIGPRLASGATGSPPPQPASSTVRESAAKPSQRVTLLSFQTRLRKLDQDIREAEERLKQLRTQAEAERWGTGRLTLRSRGNAASKPQTPLAKQIQELETKLNRLQLDRSDTFQAGRKAGYLPGELENRGIIR